MRIDGSGNVGIGLTNPSYKLHVSGGNTYMDGNLTVTGAITAQELYVQYISSSIIYSTGSNKFGDATNDIQYFTGSILQSGSLAYFAGNVGIGTASPTRQLELAGSDAYIQLTRSSTSTQATLGFNTGATNDWLIRTGDGSTSDLQFYSYGNSSYVMTIARSSGNVGIGTATPNYKLEVSGSTNVYHRLDVGTGIDFPAGTSNAIATFKQAGSTGGIILQEAGGTSNDRILKLNSNGDEQSIEATYRDTGPYGNLAFKTSGSTRMYISSSGDVGIGTTSPAGKLHIADDGPNALRIGDTQVSTIGETNDGGYPGMKIVPYNSNIHIGISSTNDNKINLWHGGSNYTYWQQLSTYSIFSNYSTDALALQIHGGNVGIGITNPNEKLHVAGNIHAYAPGGIDGGLYASTSGGSTTIAIRSNGTTVLNGGNVGIGTTSPAADGLTIRREGSDKRTLLQLDRPNTPGLQTNIRFTVSDIMVGQIQHEYVAANYNHMSFTLRSPGGGDIIPLWLENSGNVGIGTTEPGQKLTVEDTIGIKRAGVSAVSTIQQTGTGLTVNAPNGYHPLVIQHNSSELFRFTNGGNLGIGTTSPNGLLEVYSTTNTTARIKSAGASGSAMLTINPEGAGAGSVGDGVVFFDMNSTAWAVGVDKSESSTFKIANDVYGNFSTNNYFNITTGGNVGIGTTSPSAKLDISGSAEGRYLEVNAIAGFAGLSSGSAAMVELLNAGDGNTLFIKTQNSSRNDAAPLAVWTENNPRFLVRNDGNVGIGTTNPAAKLDIVGSNSGLALSFGTTVPNNPLFLNTYGGWSGIGMDASTAGLRLVGEYQTNNPVVDMGYYSSATVQHANWTSVMMVRQGGNVGIGTTNPGYKLDVVSSGNVIARFNGSAVAASSATEIDILGPQSNGDLNLGVGGSTFTDSTNNIQNKGFIAAGSGLSGLNLRSDAGYVQITAGGVAASYEVARFTASGNVGIGTTNPGSLLHVGPASTPGSTATPTAIQLDNQYRNAVGGNTSLKFYLYKNGNETYGIGLNNAGGIEYHSGTAGDASSYQAFYFGNSERIRFKGDGNVGIGTTNPAEKLAVVGNIRAGGNLVASAGLAFGNFITMRHDDTNGYITITRTVNAGHLILEPFGNVGIGTTNPSQKLSVVGDFAIANTTSIQESRIGKYQSGSLGSGTHTIASVSVTGVDAVFFDYVIKNSTTDMRAGTVMAVTNGSTVEYTDISTADIGDTTRITMISDVSGGNIRLRASIDTGSGSWTVRTLIRTI